MSSIPIRGLLAATLVASLAATSYAQEARVELVSSIRSGADGQLTSARTGPRSTAVLRRTIAVNLTRAGLETALVEITRSAEIELTYSKELLPGDDAEDGVTLQATSIGVGDAIEQVLRGTGLDVLVSEEGMAVLVRRPEPPAEPTPAQPQTGTISGRVTDAGSGAGATDASTGEVIPSVEVVIEETQQNALTDAEGLYRFEDVPAGSYTLTANRLGYTEASQRVTVVADEEVSADFALEVAPAALEGIVVTGSRIRRAAVEGPSPVTIVSREEIERSGRATVAEALATLSQNVAVPFQSETASLIAARVDLRGMGSDNTLVLVNGRRAANSGFGPNGVTTFVDLNSIPLSAVERIEVLTDGASAVYGSDALAGVVNIVLKDDFRGMEVSVNYGVSSEGGASERRVSFTTGATIGTLRGVLTGEYFNRGSLSATDRAFTSGDNRDGGGRDLRSTFSNPGNVFSLDGQNLPGLDAPEAGIPAGQDGKNLTPADFAPTVSELNYRANSRDLISPSERWGLSGQTSWPLRSELTLFAEAGFSHTTNKIDLGYRALRVTVPASNPFNPFGRDVRVDWQAPELGSWEPVSRTDNLRALLGLDGRLAGEWAWETSFGYSRDELATSGASTVDIQVVNAQLNRTDPAGALNVFGDGAGANTPAVLEELRQESVGRPIDGVSDVLNWGGHLDGVLARWAGRELRVAVGAEYRKENMDWKTLNVSPQTPPEVENSATGGRDVVAAFVELALPLFGPEYQRPGARALELQLAGRWESYSDFGDTFNPRMAVRWQPIRALTLRASASTGFRAPALHELFLAGQEYPGVSVVDPRRNDETTSVLLRTGGNPDLGPEESENWNVGLVWDVPGVPGLSLIVDWYELQKNEDISRGSFLRSELTAEIEAAFPDRFRRAEPTPEDVAAGLPGRLLEIDTRDINVSQVTARGVDLGVNYVNDSAAGRFDLRLNGAYIDHLAVRRTPFSPVEQMAGTTSSGTGSAGSAVRFRANAAVFWSRGAWDLGVTERYTGAPRETNISTASPTLGRRLDEHFETDLQLNYRLPGMTGALAGTGVSLGVENVFNREPAFRDVELGYNGSLHSPRQRFAYLTLTKAF